MIRKPYLLFSFALCLAAVIPSSLPAAEDVVSLVPQDAVGFVLISRVGESSGKLEKLATRLDLEVPSPLGMFKLLSGIEKGLDEKGNAALVYLPGEEGVTDGFPIVLLPVADYQALVAQFGAQDPDAKIIEVPVAGAPVLIGHKGDYAVFAEPDHEDALKKVLANEKGMGPGLESLRSWMAQNDVSAVATSSGVQSAIKQAVAGLETAKQGMEEARANFGEEQSQVFDQAIQSIQMYLNALHFLGREVRVAGVGLHIVGDGDVHVKTRTVFSEGGDVAQFATKVKPLGLAPLAGLPDDPFLIAGSANFGEGLGNALVEWSLNIIKANPGMYGFKELTDEQAKKLAEISGASMRNLKWMSVLMGPGEEDEPIYGSVLGAVGVADAKQYLADYEKNLKAWNEVAEKAGAEQATGWELERVEIGGEKGLKASMDFAKMAAAGQGAAAAAMMEEMMEKMFGPGGKMTMYFAPADETTVLIAYTSKEKLEAAIASFKSGKSALAKNPAVLKTAEKLPKNAVFQGYLDLSGGVTFVNRVMRSFAPTDFELPKFAAHPPVGAAAVLAGNSLETDLVVPLPTLKAGYEYSQKVQAIFMEDQLEEE